MPNISVIMLTYNREDLISRAIESILNQTYKDFEFIVVDNGSSDRSGSIALEYAQWCGCMKVIRRERGNIGVGRNTGLDAARGEWIAFIDDDDWCEPDFLSFLYGLTSGSKVKMSICGSACKPFNEKRYYSPEEALIELFNRKKFNVQFPTKLIHSSLFKNLRFSESNSFDDIELMPLIVANAGFISYHGLPKYTFYRHEGNNSSWTTNHELLNTRILDEYLHVYTSRTVWLCDCFPQNKLYWNYFNWSFRISMVEKITRLKISDCYIQRDGLIKELQKNKNEFIHCPWIKDFEKEWMTEYA